MTQIDKWEKLIWRVYHFFRLLGVLRGVWFESLLPLELLLELLESLSLESLESEEELSLLELLELEELLELVESFLFFFAGFLTVSCVSLITRTSRILFLIAFFINDKKVYIIYYIIILGVAEAWRGDLTRNLI